MKKSVFTPIKVGFLISVGLVSAKVLWTCASKIMENLLPDEEEKQEKEDA